MKQFCNNLIFTRQKEASPKDMVDTWFVILAKETKVHTPTTQNLPTTTTSERAGGRVIIGVYHMARGAGPGDPASGHKGATSPGPSEGPGLAGPGEPGGGHPFQETPPGYGSGPVCVV